MFNRLTETWSFFLLVPIPIHIVKMNTENPYKAKIVIQKTY